MRILRARAECRRRSQHLRHYSSLLLLAQRALRSGRSRVSGRLPFMCPPHCGACTARMCVGLRVFGKQAIPQLTITPSSPGAGQARRRARNDHATAISAAAGARCRPRRRPPSCITPILSTAITQIMPSAVHSRDAVPTPVIRYPICDRAASRQIKQTKQTNKKQTNKQANKQTETNKQTDNSKQKHIV